MSQSQARLFSDLVGPGHVLTGGEDDAVDGIVPRWIVRPGCAEEAAAVVDLAVKHDLSLVASGLKQHLSIGAPPRRLDVLLRTTRLDGVLAHEAADMTVRVAAGCSLAALERRLARAGQWLPLDPPAPASTTVGGMLAANLSGPLRASQGTARDLLIGIRTTGLDGTLVSGGGRVVKNVAGYDLPKLHVGALGTLGVIVDATFKVRPKPAHECAVILPCDHPEQAGELALAVRDACEPLWLEIIGPSVAGIEGFAVVAGAGGPALEVEDALARYRGVAGAAGRQARSVEDGARLRGRIGAFAASPVATVLRAATLPTEVGAVLRGLVDSAARIGLDVKLQAHAANGVVRAVIEPLASPGALAALVREMRPRLETGGGSLVVERATTETKRTLEPDPGIWGAAGETLPLMRGLKAAFDPGGCLAPGRFVGGL